MKVLVTGRTGFAGRWLERELVAAGHEVPGDPASTRVDVRDADAVSRQVEALAPDCIIHLAAVAFGPDAEADPATAIHINVGGTAAVMAAARSSRASPAVVVVGSADVYGRPGHDGALDETAATLPRRAYGLSKLAQEGVALASASSVRVAVLRPFNHTGPGQRSSFAVPAFAQRILAARREHRGSIVGGNLDVRRDIGDVRDTVRAYRLVGEGLVDGSIASGAVLNVATGRATRIGDIVDRLGRLAGHPVAVDIDPALVRADDPPVIIGDAGGLRAATGWAPTIPLETTLQDVLEDVAGRG